MGKITYKNGLHPSRIGSLVPDPKFYESDMIHLSEYLGKPITKADYPLIVDFVELISSLRECEGKTPNQDVLATLKSIGANPSLAVSGYENCDVTTEQLIIAALYQIGVKKLDHPSVAQIRAAALLALEDLPKEIGGRPSVYYRDRFFVGIVELWKKLGGESCTVWANYDDETTPLVSFAQYILEAIEPEGTLSNSVVAKSLRKVIA
jgi:hypothetical protein